MIDFKMHELDNTVKKKVLLQEKKLLIKYENFKTSLEADILKKQE